MKLAGNQSGFTLVQAIFILVVLALLGVYMVTMFTVQQSTSTLALQQARAYQAARAGVEWVVNRISVGSPPTVSVPETFVVEETGCRVTVEVVDQATVSEAGESHVLSQIKSRAESTGLTAADADYVSRTLMVTIND
ncbi:MAG: pilus assembly protein MshP [Desulfuromonadaceae bacterium]|nr:pilus assembly protein MshP [Desulfuromonadaceae bacterium]